MKSAKECLVCKKNKDEIPITKFYYLESYFYICPQHLPILIHDLHKLIGLLPGADKLQGV